MLDKQFIRHGFAQKVSEHLLQAYLAVYLAVVGDIYIALLYLTVQQTILVIIRIAGAPVLWKLISYLSLRKVAILGLTSTAIAMSILPVAIQHPLMMLLVATLHAFGSAAYYGSFHSGLFRAIGQAEKPGKAAAMFDVSKTLGFIVASCVVFTLTGMNLTWCMPFVASLFLFFAALELLKLDLGDSLSNQTPWPGWRQYFNAVTPQCLLANFNVDQPFIKNGIPLVAVIVSPPLAFLSAAGVTTGTIISTLVGGKAFDTRNSSLLIKSALIIGACAVSYSFLSPTYFALATAVSIIAMAPISIARDARTAEETASSNNILAAMAFESARSLGGLVGNGILLALYVVTNNIPTWLPLVGFIVFIYGKLRYVLHKTGGTAF